MTDQSQTTKTLRSTQFNPGDRVIIVGPHPWAGERGVLIAFEKYGLGWKGWRVELGGGAECYAGPINLRRIA